MIPDRATLATCLICDLACGHTLADSAVRAGASLTSAKRILDEVRTAHNLPPTTAPLIAWAAAEGLLDGLGLGGDPGAVLPARQRQILRFLATALSARQIGGRLGVSENTVKAHMRITYGQIGARTRAHAVALDWRYRYSAEPVVERVAAGRRR